MDKILEDADLIITMYESGVWQSADNLRAMLRELNGCNYHLTKFNIDYHEKHNAVQYKHKGTVSSGIILANEQYPEIRMLRKIMSSYDNVMRSMTMELSIIKKES